MHWMAIACGLIAGILFLRPVSSTAAASPDPEVIRIAAVALQSAGKPGYMAAAQYVSEDQKLLADLQKRHVRLEWVPVSPTSVAALVNENFTSHRIDFAFYGDLPSIILNASGFQTRLVAPGNLGNNVYLVVPPASTAKSIADLKGKRIALHRGRPWEVSFGKLVASNGLKVTDFKIVNLNPQAGASALVAGSVDAFFTLDDAYLLSDKNVGRIIWSSQRAPLDWKMRAELWGTREFVEQHPELTQLLVNADLRAVAWISQEQNRSRYIKDLADRYGYPESVVQRDSENANVSWKDYWSPLYTPSVTQHYEAVAAYARSAGLIRTDVDVKTLIVPKFVDEGLKELSLGNYWVARATP